MKDTIQVLKEKKIRVTPQRVAVYDLLAKSNNHLTAESIYERIKSVYPALSLATVYSILQIYKKENLIHEIRIDFERSFFDSENGMHHHFYCMRCKNIFDVSLPPCPSLCTHEVDGCLIEDFQGYFYGVCRVCRKNKRTAP